MLNLAPYPLATLTKESASLIPSRNAFLFLIVISSFQILYKVIVPIMTPNYPQKHNQTTSHNHVLRHIIPPPFHPPLPSHLLQPARNSMHVLEARHTIIRARKCSRRLLSAVIGRSWFSCVAGINSRKKNASMKEKVVSWSRPELDDTQTTTREQNAAELSGERDASELRGGRDAGELSR